MNAARSATGYKGIYLTKRAETLSEEAFPRRWKQHAVLFSSLRLQRNYFTGAIQVRRRLEAACPADATRDYDGVSLLPLTDPEIALMIYDEPDVQRIILPDELETFSRYIRDVYMIAQEHEILPGPRTPHVVVEFLKCRQSFETDTVFEAWRQARPQGEVAPGQESGVARHAVDRVICKAPLFDFDLVSELWFRTSEDAQTYFADPAVKAYREAGRREFFQPETSITFSGQVTHAFPPLEA